MKKVILMAVAFALFSFAGCDKIQNLLPFKKTEIKPLVSQQAQTAAVEEVQGTKLAKVNNKVITFEEFEQNIKNLQTLSEEIKITTTEQKKGLLDEMINQELLYAEAKSRGVPEKKEIKDLADGYLRGLAVRQLVLDITENVTVDPQEIETFYNQYKDQLTEPPQLRVREIVVSSEERAREILIGLLQGQDFATVVNEKSIGSSKKTAGDAGFIKRGERGEKYQRYDEVAFSLELNQVSSIFKGPEGYYIIKVEEIREEKPKALSDVYDEIKNNLLNVKQQQRVQELIDKLRQNAQIEINEELLK